MKGKIYSAQPVQNHYGISPAFVAGEDVLKLAQQEKYRALIRPGTNTVLNFIRLNFPFMLLYIVVK